MKRALAKGFERLADQSASLSLGCAIAYSAYHLLPPETGQPALVACAAAAAVVAYRASRSLLRLVGTRRPAVAVVDAKLENGGTVSAMGAAESDLALEARARPEPDSPVVVRLFDPAQLAASGPSTDRYDSLGVDPSRAVLPDASQSLHEALNQLRQSLASRR